jgi:hypothetical protein
MLLTSIQPYWQVVLAKDATESGAPSGCGFDGFEIGIASSKGDVASAMKAANAATANQSWAGFVYYMQSDGVTVGREAMHVQ